MPDYDQLSASDGSGEAVLANVENNRSIGAVTLDVDSVDNWPAEFIFCTGTLNANNYIDNSSMTIMYGHLDSGNIVIDGYAPGYTDVGNTAGQIAIIKPTTNWIDSMVENIRVEHKDDGTHSNVTADSVKVLGVDVTHQSLYQNGIINGGCMVAQRVVPNLSTTYQYGKVDRFAAKGTGTLVSAGTVTQNTSSLLAATKGYEIKLAGVTITGTGIVYLRYRMEARDALMFKNQPASFSCRIYQDTGGAVNATVYINKANAADNFAAVTAIANSGAISVPNNTATAVKFENINAGSLGDCSNGLEIEIQLACGAVTTKNFTFAEFQFNVGAKAATWQPRPYIDELEACQRYFESTFPDGVAPQNGPNGTTFYDGGTDKSGYFSVYAYQISLGQIGSYHPFRIKKRTVPTMTGYGNSSGQWKYWQTGGGSAWTAMNSGLGNPSSGGWTGTVNASGSSDQGVITGHFTADAEL